MTNTILRIALIATLTSCAIDEPELAEETSELLTSDWSTPAVVASQQARYGGVMATLNGTTYLVHSGIDAPQNLWWTKLGPGGWQRDAQIPNQYSSGRPKLAAFNNRLYMFHSGYATSDEVWVSSFDPATQTWRADFRVGFRSKGAPAIAAYQGLLYIVGVSPSTNQLYMATMTASEAFSAPTLLGYQYSASPVSLAVYNNRLFMAHRAGTTTGVVVNSFDGVSWGADRYAPVSSTEPSIAAYGGRLHMVHLASNNLVEWLYGDGTSWSVPVTIGSQTSTIEPVLASRDTGLIDLLTSDWYSNRFMWTSTYHPSVP